MAKMAIFFSLPPCEVNWSQSSKCSRVYVLGFCFVTLWIAVTMSCGGRCVFSASVLTQMKLGLISLLTLHFWLPPRIHKRCLFKKKVSLPDILLVEKNFWLLWRNMTATRGDVHSTRRVHAHARSLAHSLAGSGFVSLARYGGVRDPFSHDMLSPVVSRVFSVLYLFVLSI